MQLRLHYRRVEMYIDLIKYEEDYVIVVIKEVAIFFFLFFNSKDDFIASEHLKLLSFDA